MLLDVFHGLPMLSFQLSLQTGKQKKVARSQVGTVRGLGDHRSVAPGQVVGNDEGRVMGALSWWSLIAAQASRRPCAFADSSSLSHVPQMWTCLGCQRCTGCSIDGRNAKLRTHDSRFRRFWPLLGVQNGVRRRPPPGPP